MTQEDKDLLLKELCSRLPYGVKVLYENKVFSVDHISAIYEEIKLDIPDNYTIDISDIKPYLFPLSSMTDEMWDKEFRGYGITEFTRDSFKYGCETLEFNNNNPNLLNTVKFINQLIKNHFDIYGLIEKGLANDATGLNIY
jgi:hypothetical protein